VHLQALGHPIVGDALYDPSWGAPLAMTDPLENRLRLHASALAFDHPVTGVKLRFDSLAPF
jgi:tRNA pseudouridine32 synthase/23S rRNA pseudouridine746 synthase